MMSGKTPLQPAAEKKLRAFYGESPPKRSRLNVTDDLTVAATITTNTITASTSSPRTATLKSFKGSNSSKIDKDPVEQVGASCIELKVADQKQRQPNQQQQQLHQPQHQLTNEPNGHDEHKDLDRDSPIPLRNLGNTCYENSIIQCLFSLNMFMDNFEQSMQVVQRLVDKPQRHVTYSNSKNDAPSISEHADDVTFATITKDDVRYRIANAFYNLYRCYALKKIQIANIQADHVSSCQLMRDQLVNGTSDSRIVSSHNIKSQSDDAISMSNSAIPLYKSDSNEQSKALVLSERNQTTTDNTFTSNNLTPVALVSSAATSTNEQSEIETRLEDLKSAVGERSSQFNSTHQQDASEFFYHVIDSIQEFYQSLDKTEDDDNPVTKAFELEFDYMIRCPKCHHKIMSEPEKIRTLPLALPHLNCEPVDRNDEFNAETNGAPTPPNSDLGLDSPKSNSSSDLRNDSDEKGNQALEDEDLKIQEENPTSNTVSIAKLDLTDKPEQNSQNENQKHYTLNDALNNFFKDDLLDYKCSQAGCDSKQRTKKCLIRKLPQVLFITLARYSHNGKKNLDEIEAPFELSVPIQENKSPSHSDSVSNQFNDDDNEYRLVAVVCHLGSSLNAGHYTSYVYNQNNSSWYSCDDDSITKVQESEVKNDASMSGYCFFYAHKSCFSSSKSAHDGLVTTDTKQPNNSNHTKGAKATPKMVAAHRDNGVVESSVVLTPESSPKSIPSPPPLSTAHVDSRSGSEHDINHSHCASSGADGMLDDWS